MSWDIVKLGSVLQNREARYKPNNESIAGLKRIDKIDFSGKIYLSDKSSNTDMILIKKGDLVISGINIEKGAMAVYEGDEDIIATIHYSSYIFNKEKIDIDFLKHFLKSQEFKKAIKEQVPGGIKTEIKPKHLLPLEIFIPTNIDEQRIVVEKLNGIEKENQKISSELTHQLDLVKQLRQSFLREAMQGKLVAHSEGDGEFGSELLSKIKKEKRRLFTEGKIKRQNEYARIRRDEVPFEIPYNWVWGRLGEICSKIGSGSTPKGSNYTTSGYPFFRSQNIHDAGLVYDDIKFVSPDVQRQMNGTSVFANDILLNITGGSLGRCSLVPSTFKEGNVSQHVCIIRPVLVNHRFLHLMILNPFFQKYIFSSTTGAGREGLPKYNLEQFVIPLPPLTEQHRIVEKLDQLMGMCDELEASIRASQSQNEMLLQQVLREALGLKSFVIKEKQKGNSNKKVVSSKYDSNTLLMEIQELLKIHGKLHANDLWKMSKFYGKTDDERNIDGFYAELKKLIEKEKVIKETEKSYLELV